MADRGHSMADPARRNANDRGGEWFVDTTCIDCDVARMVAPGLIEEDEDGLSYFTHAPATPEEEAMAWRAVLACPTGSVGAPRGKRPPDDVFPWRLTAGVHLTGYNSRDSFGANAWFVQRDEGNLLVDAPRWQPRLADAFERMGGLEHVLLTHRDDVADHARYAERFSARIWIHESERSAAPTATDLLDADAEIAGGVRAVHIPGHTRGSVAFHVDDEHLFTGDSLYWSRHEQDLSAFRGATWYDWDALADSLERLADEVRFSWVLPGHGGWGHAPADEMHERLVALVARMRAGEVEGRW